MAVLVHILAYVHELTAAGIDADFWDVLDRPEAYWQRLPAERRTALLPGSENADVDVSAVKRRGRSATKENVYIRLASRSQGGLATTFASARDRLFFEPVESLPTFEVMEPVGATPQVFRAVTSAVPPPSFIKVLDSAWGVVPYVPEADGHFVEQDEAVTGEIERYWVEEPFAQVRIVLDAENHTVYELAEPTLSEMERRLSVTVNRRLADVLVFEPGDNADRAARVAREVFALVKTYAPKADRRTCYKLGYYFLRNYVGLGRLEPVMRDMAVEDISCNGPNVPLYLVHSRHQNLRTSLRFQEMELNSYTIKLAQRGGKLLSIAQPLVDATLHDGSRIQASLGREVTAHGSAFTIRKFREDPLTCVDLIRSGTHSVDSMAHLWLSVELKRSLIVMGATASGKTTTLNCLSQFIPPTSKIVTIEDTREIVLQHENWLAAVTRDSFTKEGTERISMYDLLRAALRQRPEYIIVGEIRGAEGLTLFQAMSTGHTCFSTMHAGSVENAVHRLENPPIDVPRVMLSSLDSFMLQAQIDVKGHSERRMLSLTEVTGIDPGTRNVRTNEVFRWDSATDKVVPGVPSASLEAARDRRGWSRARLEEELQARRRVLEGLVERNERHYRQVGKAIHTFYLEQAARESRAARAAVAAPPAARRRVGGDAS